MRALFFRLFAVVLAFAPAVACTPQTSGPAPSGATPGQVALATQAYDARHQQLLRVFGGAYDEPRVQGYVERVGRSLVESSRLGGRPWRFTVLNTPIVNAVAMAPGDVYVTRGLLLQLESEAELAAVMSHEIGHIVARHSERELTLRRQFSTGIARALESFDIEQALRLRTDALRSLSRYSREYEIEADDQGLAFLRGAGYAAGAAAGALERLAAADRLERRLLWRPESEAVGPLSTHPSLGERIGRMRPAALSGTGREGRDEHLAAIDGMIAEDDASQGFVRGSRFVHPTMRFAFDAPPGFRIVNRTDAVRSFGRDGSFLGLDCAPAQQEATSLVRELERQGQAYNLADVQGTRINGFEAASGVGRVRHRDGRMFDVRMAAVRFGSLVCAFFGYASPAAEPGRLDALVAASRSFRPLGEAEAARLAPWRVRIVETRAGDSVESLAARMAYLDLKSDRFRAINALGPDEPVAAGRKVKLVVE